MDLNSNNIRYSTAVASLRLVKNMQVFDMTQDDFNFLTKSDVWVGTDRGRARRCVEAVVYGALDYCGYPRFPAPAEFISAAIAYFVHPVNLQTACLIMEGAEFAENIVNGIEKPLKAAEIFAHVLYISSLNFTKVDAIEDVVKMQFHENGV